KKRKKEKKQDPLPPLDISDTTDITVKEIFVAHEIQVKELSELVAQPVSKIISTLMNLGLMVTQNQFIDYETAAILAHELGIEIHHKEPEQTTVIEKIIPEE
ncbi:translation initiation factor IF-2 N-terminal domain-containing protein, partial [Arthrospira platensis SPKY1]|nr:translation initiation factor IF-2 N-terminal domain-containing protein [Arthrospira platensis SPKY1]